MAIQHPRDGADGNSYRPTGRAAKSAAALPIRLLARKLFGSLVAHFPALPDPSAFSLVSQSTSILFLLFRAQQG